MEVNDPHMVFDSLVNRRLSGELSPDELIRFQDALSKDPDLQLRFEELLKIWDSVEGVAAQEKYDLDAEWKDLSSKIPDLDAEQPSLAKGRSLLFYTYRIAAALVVGVLFSFAWIYATKIAGKQVAEAGMEPMEILLEDGTHVVLNRDSKIRYSKNLGEGERQVTLKGEAWFDVTRDSLRPFVIDAGRAMVEVLGTSFNVNAYEENPIVEITVESGVVAVTAKEDLEEQLILRAGNSGSYNPSSHKLQLETAYNPNNLSWKTRELFFEDSPLYEVADLIAKVYNVNIQISGEDLASCPITVSFSEQSLDAVLNVLEETLDLEITRSGELIILDGEACIE